MKLHIATYAAIVVAAAAVATGCSGSKENKSEPEDNAALTAAVEPDLRGQWHIENIVFNDSDYVRPDEAVPGISQYFVFEDSTYFIMTNCNSFSGTYTVKGDTISLGDAAMTELACDNMQTEEALRRILPRISTIDIQNDSVVRLNGALPAECILLRKAKTEIK